MSSRLFPVLPLLLTLAACEPGTPPPAQPMPAGRDLAPWQGRFVELFPDAIEPAAVGLAMLPSSPRSDPNLRDRTQYADFIARVRVSTATSDLVREQTQYHLVVAPFGDPLVGGPPPPARVELLVRPGSPAFGIAKAMEGRLVGRSFIGFFRAFAGPEEPVVHWYLAPDLPETAAAVREAAALGEFIHR